MKPRLTRNGVLAAGRYYVDKVGTTSDGRGVNSLVWTLPILMLVLGAVLVVVKLNKLKNVAPPPPAAMEDEYVTRVRDLVNK